jgi:hypothetical protein
MGAVDTKFSLSIFWQNYMKIAAPNSNSVDKKNVYYDMA